MTVDREAFGATFGATTDPCGHVSSHKILTIESNQILRPRFEPPKFKIRSSDKMLRNPFRARKLEGYVSRNKILNATIRAINFHERTNEGGGGEGPALAQPKDDLEVQPRGPPWARLRGQHGERLRERPRGPPGMVPMRHPSRSPGRPWYCFGPRRDMPRISPRQQPSERPMEQRGKRLRGQRGDRQATTTGAACTLPHTEPE